MSRLGRVAYGALLLVSFTSAAAAQEQDSGWFESEVPQSETETEAETSGDPPEVEADETPPPAPEPRAQPERTKPRATDEPERHHHHDWHHHDWHRRGSRSIALIGGRMRLEAPELVSSLESAGFGDPTELEFVGLQGTRVIGKRFVLGLGGTFGWSDAFERDDGARGRLRLMQLRGSAGIALVHSPKWLLYPALELGLNHVEIDIGAPGRASFDQALAEPRTGTELTRTSVAAGGVIAVERRFAFHRRDRGDWTRYFAIGLRAGWMRDLSESPWRVDGDGDALGPEERHTIKYIGLTLGFGHARF